MRSHLLKALTSLFFVAQAACQSDGLTVSEVKDDGPHDHISDPPAVHGMLMVGDGPVYLSHLPMFHKPHDYQVLLEVDLKKSGSDPTATYADDRRVTGEKVYTLVPEPFVLSELFTPPNTPTRKTFKASIFRGHFERGGQRILSNVTVEVKRVIHARQFDKNPSPLASLEYLVFGNKTELFAAHVVTMKPDFDHVVAIRIDGGVLTDAQADAIREGKVAIFTGAPNTVEQALKEGSTVDGRVKVNGGTLSVSGQILTDFYLETGDLSF